MARRRSRGGGGERTRGATSGAYRGGKHEMDEQVRYDKHDLLEALDGEVGGLVAGDGANSAVVSGWPGSTSAATRHSRAGEYLPVEDACEEANPCGADASGREEWLEKDLGSSVGRSNGRPPRSLVRRWSATWGARARQLDPGEQPRQLFRHSLLCVRVCALVCGQSAGAAVAADRHYHGCLAGHFRGSGAAHHRQRHRAGGAAGDRRRCRRLPAVVAVSRGHHLQQRGGAALSQRRICARRAGGAVCAAIPLRAVRPGVCRPVAVDGALHSGRAVLRANGALPAGVSTECWRARGPATIRGERATVAGALAGRGATGLGISGAVHPTAVAHPPADDRPGAVQWVRQHPHRHRRARGAAAGVDGRLSEFRYTTARSLCRYPRSPRCAFLYWAEAPTAGMDTSRPLATCSACAVPHSACTSASPNASAVPGPCEVIKWPSTTTWRAARPSRVGVPRPAYRPATPPRQRGVLGGRRRRSARRPPVARRATRSPAACAPPTPSSPARRRAPACPSCYRLGLFAAVGHRQQSGLFGHGSGVDGSRGAGSQ
eukprot:ctg_683.g250